MPLRIGEDRRREAVDKVTAFSFDRHGNRIGRDAAALLASEHARYAVGEVAVPYGRCAEPSNVAAGSRPADPVPLRGYDRFRTDVSHLPDLTAYLDDLLQTRERLAAAIDGADEWARADAASPAEQEITRIRALIARIQGDIAQLTDAERAQIEAAVAAGAPAPRRLARHARHPPRRRSDPVTARTPAGRQRDRPRGRSRPHLPLPPPRPARQDPRPPSRPGRRRPGQRTRRHPRFPAS